MRVPDGFWIEVEGRLDSGSFAPGHGFSLQAHTRWVTHPAQGAEAVTSLQVSHLNKPWMVASAAANKGFALPPLSPHNSATTERTVAAIGDGDAPCGPRLLAFLSQERSGAMQKRRRFNRPHPYGTAFRFSWRKRA